MLNHQSGEFFNLDDARIYYETTGAPNGPSLILLHGGLGSLEDFYPIVERLSDSFHLIAVDMRGHGRSALGVRPLTYQQHQLDIQALIAHLGLQEYSLLGFSDGGIVAYRIAVGNEAVRALVTVGAQWRISPEDPSFEMLAGVTVEMWAGMFPDAPKEYATLNPGGSFDKLVESCVGLWTDVSPTGYPRDAIEGIDCPTLILRGDGDFLFSLAEAAEAQQKISGASFGNIPFASHAAMEDTPKIISDLIHDFVLDPRKLEVEA